MKEAKKNAKRLERKRLKDSLPPEPEAGHPEIARVRLLFPDGVTQLDRKFRLDEPAKVDLKL